MHSLSGRRDDGVRLKVSILGAAQESRDRANGMQNLRPLPSGTLATKQGGTGQEKAHGVQWGGAWAPTAASSPKPSLIGSHSHSCRVLDHLLLVSSGRVVSRHTKEGACVLPLWSAVGQLRGQSLKLCSKGPMAKSQIPIFREMGFSSISCPPQVPDLRHGS
jgi:hypothetical protein